MFPQHDLSYFYVKCISLLLHIISLKRAKEELHMTIKTKQTVLRSFLCHIFMFLGMVPTEILNVRLKHENLLLLLWSGQILLRKVDFSSVVSMLKLKTMFLISFRQQKRL